MYQQVDFPKLLESFKAFGLKLDALPHFELLSGVILFGSMRESPYFVK
jgi:hypothetical protein